MLSFVTNIPQAIGHGELAGQDQAGFWGGLTQLYRTMSPARRRQFYLLTALMIGGAFAELATIGAVLPFLSLLADPHWTKQVPLLASAFDTIGAVSGSERLLTATGLFILFALIAGGIRLQLAWSSQNFVFRLGHELATGIQRRMLLQPYAFHVGQNTSSIIASLEKVDVLTFAVVQQGLQAAIAAFIALFVIAALVYVDPFSALLAASAFAAVYVLVSALTRRRLAQDSEIVGASYDQRVKILQESLGGIRDVIIDGSHAACLDSFRLVDDRFNRARASTAFISSAPRFVIEAVGMIVIALLAIALSGGQGGFVRALPILGALALGAQRLLPLLQQINLGWSLAAGNKSVVEQVLDLLRLPTDEQPANQIDQLELGKRIRIDHACFAYPGRGERAAQDISLDIPKGCLLALVGRTGSGKSTLADMIMGLIEPGSGEILIDGIPLTRDNRRSWQRGIAHVPQTIFLADASIAHNIALGAPGRPIQLDRVREAARQAQLADFIDTLPEGYRTHVGERGIRLSGGQRQRLGIARAIYKDSPVLVLDEATSALDDETEAAVMDALEELGGERRTIIMIGHRPSTIARADMVVRLEGGRVAAIDIPAGQSGAAAKLDFPVRVAV